MTSQPSIIAELTRIVLTYVHNVAMGKIPRIDAKVRRFGEIYG